MYKIKEHNVLVKRIKVNNIVNQYMPNIKQHNILVNAQIKAHNSPVNA